MILELLSNVMKDKEVVLRDGRSITCSNLRGLHKNCKETTKTENSRIDFCGNYYKMAFKCYTKSQMTFEDVVDKEIKDFHKLMDYLDGNKSKLPNKLIANKNINFLNYLMYNKGDSIPEEDMQSVKEREHQREQYKATLEDYKKYYS